MDEILDEQSDVDKAPRALIVDLSANFGGTNARILAMIKRLPKDGVGLATITGSPIASELEAAGYTVHRVAKNKFDPRIPLRIARIVRADGYEIVDTQNPQSKLWGSLGAMLGGGALVSTLNSWYMTEHPRYTLRWFGYSAIELLTNMALARYIVVSREIQNSMLRLGIPAHKIDLIYNAFQIDGFELSGDRSDWLERYGLPPNTFLCVAAGRLSWAKGHDNLIRAMQILAAQDRLIHCLIAGDGELRQDLETQINNSGLKGRVILLGHLSRPEVLSLINACDVFVMPSRTEGTPIALLEAATLGKPILASCVGGIPEIIKNEEDGLLVPVDQPSELADGIRRLVQEPTLVLRLVHNAYQKVVQNFTLDVQVDSTIRSYVKALQKGNVSL